jgi:hypothetical protein
MQGAGLRAAALALVGLALLLGAAGCGSGSSSSSEATTPAGGTTSSPVDQGEPTGPAGKEAAGDNSIEGYGGAAQGSDKEAVSAAVDGFLAAMASGDYATVCTDLIAANREGLEAFGEKGGASDCAATLKQLLSPAAAGEAKAAAAAPITSVRIKGDTAFAIFTPRGGQPSYVVMKQEGGSWKAISVAPGTPLEPTANG